MSSKSKILTSALVVVFLFSSLSIIKPVETQSENNSAPAIEWQKTGFSGISRVIQTSDGGFALTGSIPLNPSFVGGPWLIKTDSQGNVQWNQSYYIKYPDLNLGGVGPIVQTSDGGYLLGGNYYHAGAFLLKTDSKGNVQWIKSYPSKEYVGDLIKSPVGGYLISGAYQNGTGCWLAMVDSNGIVQWNRDFDGVFIFRIVQANDGEYAMIGEVLASNEFGATTLIKTDSKGDVIWNQTYGSSIQFIRFVQATDTGYALAGNTFRTNSSQGAALLTKTDSLGNVVWNQTYSQFGEGTIWDITKTSDGGYALGFGDHFTGDFVKVDATGNLQWNITFSFDNPSNVHSIMQLSDGSYVFLAGNALTKTFSDGSLPSVTPTNTVPEFTAPATTIAVLIIATIVILAISFLILHRRNRKTQQVKKH